MTNRKYRIREILQTSASHGKALFAISLSILISSCGRESDAPKKASDNLPAQAVKTITVESKPMERTVTVTGSFVAREHATLTVKSPGRLQSVAVDVGSVVKKGDLLAQIDRGDYELR